MLSVPSKNRNLSFEKAPWGKIQLKSTPRHWKHIQKYTTKDNKKYKTNKNKMQSILCYFGQLLQREWKISCKWFPGLWVSVASAWWQQHEGVVQGEGGVLSDEGGFFHHWAPVQFTHRGWAISVILLAWFIIRESIVFCLVMRRLSQDEML